MEEPEIVDLTDQDYYEDGYDVPDRPTKDQKYFTDITKCLNLLSACVVVPNGEGKAELNFLITDSENRVELENYVMNLTRKNLSTVINVNEVGFKPRKKRVTSTIK